MRFRTIFAIVAILSVGLAAHADTYTVTLDSVAATFSFSIPSNPTPALAIAGDGWGIYTTATSGTFSGDTVEAVFLNADAEAIGEPFDGGFVYMDTNNGDEDFFPGPQLYTGTESAPTMSLGTFTLTEYFTGDTATITIADSTVTPEPSSFLLLGTGLLGALVLMRKRLLSHGVEQPTGQLFAAR